MMEQKDRYKIINGDSLQVLDTLEENSIDAIITDPPYELGFMSKKWDKTGIAYNVELWKKALRVLKSGGYLLAFGGTRTYHRIACAIEDAGFEIRDCIMWLYGSGFPKSMNIGFAIDKKNGIESVDTGIISPNARPNRNTKEDVVYGFGTVGKDFTIKKANNEWDGWGTALKPAYEPIIVARKPVKGSVVDNVLKYGVGGINIDECRVGDEHFTIDDSEYDNNENQSCYGNVKRTPKEYNGRFPANVILTYDDTDFDEVCGNMPFTSSSESMPNTDKTNSKGIIMFADHKSGYHYGDEGSACRYFYCAKASKKDRDNGLDLLEERQTTDGCIRSNSETAGKFGANSALRKNIHPTVKPCELMQYLIKLVCPTDATILDIFNGSGSTGKAVAFENRERNKDYKYIGIELDPEYCKISEMRIDYAINKYEYDMIQDIKKEEEETGQMSLFDL